VDSAHQLTNPWCFYTSIDEVPRSTHDHFTHFEADEAAFGASATKTPILRPGEAAAGDLSERAEFFTMRACASLFKERRSGTAFVDIPS